MGAKRESVRLTIEGTDLMVSIFPEDGEVRVTSGKFILEANADGTAREAGHTLVITRGQDNSHARSTEITRRATHHVTVDRQIREI